MERITALIVAVGGLGAVVFSDWMARSGVDSGRRYFGRAIPDGSREHRFTLAAGRTIAVLVGGALLVSGTLGALGIIGG